MFARSSVLLLATLLLTISSVMGDDQKPPSITYGGSRSSKAWIDLPGSSVAVDDGVEWQGVKVYLGLTWHLIAVDAKTDKVLWSESVSAFWNTLSFKEVELEAGKKVWAVELRPTTRDPQAAKFTALRELRTGKKLEPPGSAEGPAGKPLKLAKVWSGDDCTFDKPTWMLFTTADNWAKARQKMFGDQKKPVAPEAKDVDFAKEVILVIANGKSTNTRGVGGEAFADQERVTLRLQHQTFQTFSGAHQSRPYGIFVLPREEKKVYVVERNRQNLKGGPALWKELYRIDGLGDLAKELERLP